MEGMDLLIVAIAFLVGYWAVSALMDRKKALPADPAYASWFRMLGVREDAALDEIAAAYQAKLRALPEDRAKELHAAFDYAMKLRAAKGSDR